MEILIFFHPLQNLLSSIRESQQVQVMLLVNESIICSYQTYCSLLNLLHFLNWIKHKYHWNQWIQDLIFKLYLDINLIPVQFLDLLKEFKVQVVSVLHLLYCWLMYSHFKLICKFQIIKILILNLVLCLPNCFYLLKEFSLCIQ